MKQSTRVDRALRAIQAVLDELDPDAGRAVLRRLFVTRPEFGAIREEYRRLKVAYSEMYHRIHARDIAAWELGAKIVRMRDQEGMSFKEIAKSIKILTGKDCSYKAASERYYRYKRLLERTKSPRA